MRYQPSRRRATPLFDGSLTMVLSFERAGALEPIQSQQAVQGQKFQLRRAGDRGLADAKATKQRNRRKRCFEQGRLCSRFS